MKRLIFIYIAAAALISCSENGNGGPGGDGELAFSATVAGYSDAARAAGPDFFGDGYSIEVTLTTSYNSTPQKYSYTYGSTGIFKGTPPFYFSLDDTYITTLKAIWPSQQVRDEGLIRDQRKLEDFRHADWLTAEATSLNIMPTSAPVPLYFERENTMLEFQIAGQNAEGIDIQYLVIELQVDDKADAFFAYCGDPNGNAQLILDGTVELAAPESYLIGRMRVTDNYEYTIIFPATDIQLEAGKRYLVTLTSQGYDVDPYVYIATFTQDENSGIGIPFASPELNEDGNFIITEPEQLVTMSYLVRHYPNPATYDWTTATYVIADGFVLTDELAALYIPIPRADYPGVSVQDEEGNAVTTVEYGSGQVLQLYN